MKRLILIMLLLLFLALPVQASENTAPSVPESAEEYMPQDTESFSEGLWHVIKTGIGKALPELTEVMGICLQLFAVVILTSVLSNVSESGKKTANLAGTLAVSLILLEPSQSLVSLGLDTAKQLADYGKLILPSLTAALAAQGGITTSAALYTGTALFSAILSACITRLLVPLVWIYLCLGIAGCFLKDETISNLKQFSKWLITWTLKITLYVFTAYMSITGVVSGSADATAIKATKLTISGFVPMVGGIISDASEAILVSAGTVKNAIGIYGMIATAAIIVGPFIAIGIQYLLLKISCALCKVIGAKETVAVIGDFSKAMGMILAMIGSLCLMLIVSMFCFMRGIQ